VGIDHIVEVRLGAAGRRGDAETGWERFLWGGSGRRGR
jgi:hypothetical protein